MSTKKFEQSAHRVSIADAKQNISNFQSKFSPVIKQTQMSAMKLEEYETTKYIWIEKQTLKDYLEMLDEVEQLNPKNGKITGVAINLAAYPEDKTTDKSGAIPKEGSYKGRLTVVLNPTYLPNGSEYNKIQNHVQFSIQPESLSNKYQGRYKPLLNSEDQGGKAQLNTKSTEEDTSLALNDLNAIPPPYK